MKFTSLSLLSKNRDPESVSRIADRTVKDLKDENSVKDLKDSGGSVEFVTNSEKCFGAFYYYLSS